jgi:lipoprotein-anchoring transpeptidase ErfK/SrfK
MRQRPPSSLCRAATLVVIALLAGSGPSACGVAGPSADHPRQEPGIGAPGPNPGADPRPRGEAASDAGRADAKDPNPSHLVLRLGERRLYLIDGDPGTPVGSFPIAIGREGWETPTGRFQIEEMVENPDFLKVDDTVVPLRVIKRIPPGPTNPLGQRWIGFAHGEGWTIGIHGTPNPELLGRAVSHGCIRMRNADVIWVYDRVHLGTPVIVEP